MITPLRNILQSNRLFYSIVAGVCGCLIVLAVFLQVRLSNQYVELCHKVQEGSCEQICWHKCFDLADYGNEIFEPYADSLTALNLSGLTTESVRLRLKQLEIIPGVRHAYCLKDGNQLISSDGFGSAELKESLRAKRSIFGRYHVGHRNLTQKFDDWLRNRIRWADIPQAGDTLRFLLTAFDSTGRHTKSLIAGADSIPDVVCYLMALDMDEQWIRKAIAEHFEYVLYNREGLTLWTPPFYGYGLGVVGFGNDTLWWFGLKSIEKGGVWEFETGHPWFKYTAMMAVDQADSTLLEENVADYRIRTWLGIGSTIFVVLLLAVLSILARQKWFARQTALSHLAHSIRTPVARLRLDVDTLIEERSVSPAQERRMIQAVGVECGRIERAVQNAVLSLEDKTPLLNINSGDLSQVIENILRPWHANFDSAGVELSYASKIASLPSRFDSEMIATLLDNLLDNALRYSRLHLQKHPTIPQKVAVTLEKQHNFAMLTVEDSNGGVLPIDRHRIFERFQRGSDSAISGASGLGLGLALVKEIAEAHGGMVAVDDSPLGGARFIVRLPFSD
jgi:signal transduction histidine kinase